MRVRALESILTDTLEKEKGLEEGYYEKCKELEKEVKEAQKEDRAEKRIDVEYSKMDELVKRLRGRVPRKVSATILDPDEIKALREYMKEKEAKEWT